MKKLEFETSKGAFFMVDAIERKNLHDGIFLKQITEEQASSIVDEGDSEPWTDSFKSGYRDYQITDIEQYSSCITAIESLHSLLKSKGIHLFDNPVIKPLIPNEQTLKKMHNKGYGENDFVDLKYDQYQFDLAEEKTFYNPVIFKL